MRNVVKSFYVVLISFTVFVGMIACSDSDEDKDCGYSSTGNRWHLTTGGSEYSSESACESAAANAGYSYYCYDGKCYGYYVR